MTLKLHPKVEEKLRRLVEFDEAPNTDGYLNNLIKREAEGAKFLAWEKANPEPEMTSGTGAKSRKSGA